LAHEPIHLDVSQYNPKKVPSLTWCDCINKIWQDDPLVCLECLSEMSITSFIDNPVVIKKILKYLDLWDDEERGSQLRTARDPPHPIEIPGDVFLLTLMRNHSGRNRVCSCRGCRATRFLYTNGKRLVGSNTKVRLLLVNGSETFF